MENYFAESGYAVTVCDLDAKILYMNRRACRTFEKYGGESLIGKSLFDCHGERSSAMIRRFLQTGESNVYTIEKAGVKKLIHQSPWYKDGKIAGLVELSLELPAEMPHYVRQP